MRLRWPFALGMAAAIIVAGGALLTDWQQRAPDIAVARHSPRAATASARYARDVAAWESSSLARPLFSRHRRPPQNAGPVVAAANPVMPAPRLTGVLVGPFGASAVFVAGGSGRSVTVQEGGQVGIYRIRRITPGQVLVDGPDGERVLRPSFGGGTGQQPAPEQRAELERCTLTVQVENALFPCLIA
jgi:hypothetical protein